MKAMKIRSIAFACCALVAVASEARPPAGVQAESSGLYAWLKVFQDTAKNAINNLR